MKKVLIPIGLLVVAVIAAGAWWWKSQEHEADHQQLTLYGNVDIRQVNLAFNGSERIATMTAQEGQRVKEGALLATLDTQRLQQSVAQAQGQVAAQREVVAALVAGTRPEEIRKARADVAAAQADAANARRTARRLNDLAARKLASQEQADNARAAADAARARLKAVKEALNLALAGPRKEDIAAARETLKAYRAQLALAQRALADARLYAPADGVIQDRILEPGDMASPQTPVYTLALTNPMWVRAYVAEPDLGRIHPGMKATVTTDSYPDQHYKAWIGYISPTSEFTPKSVETTRVRTDLVYQVRVYVCNSRDQLRLGMPATVHIALDQPDTGGNTSGASPCGPAQ
ncbi:MAG: efflux RND transporter periplasmic adaptor subunit [Gammaproteobacteria bacterium]